MIIVKFRSAENKKITIRFTFIHRYIVPDSTDY
jgi:hypothetical protein